MGPILKRIALVCLQEFEFWDLQSGDFFLQFSKVFRLQMIDEERQFFLQLRHFRFKHIGGEMTRRFSHFSHTVRESNFGENGLQSGLFIGLFPQQICGPGVSGDQNGIFPLFSNDESHRRHRMMHWI